MSAMRCTACDRTMPTEPAERNRADGSALVYLACRGCGAEYPAANVTAKGVALLSQITALRAAGKDRSRHFRRLLERCKNEVVRA